MYLVSNEPIATPLTGRKDFGCSCYSSGSRIHEETIMPRAYRSMISFFKLVADVPGYEELEQFEFGVDDRAAREVKWVAGDDEAAIPNIVISKAKEAAN